MATVHLAYILIQPAETTAQVRQMFSATCRSPPNAIGR